MNAVLSAIGKVGKYEDIHFSSSTIWCVLSGIKNLHSTGYLSSCGSLHIPWNFSITTSINEIQSTALGKSIWQWFHLKIHLIQIKTPVTRFQGVIRLTKTLIKPPPKTYFKNWKLQTHLMSMEFIPPLIFMLGVTFYKDGITMHLNIHHVEKIGVI